MTPALFDLLVIKTLIIRYAGQDAICLMLGAYDGEGDLEDIAKMEEMSQIWVVVAIKTGEVLIVSTNCPIVESVH